MARRTLEGIAFEQGEVKGDLVKRLDALSSRGILLYGLVDWAREVRLVGNVGAHFDPIAEVSL